MCRIEAEPTQSVTDEKCSGGDEPICIEDAIVLDAVTTDGGPNHAAMDTGIFHAPQAATLTAVSASASEGPSLRTSISDAAAGGCSALRHILKVPAASQADPGS